MKSRGSVSRNNFHKNKTKQATPFERRNDFMHCSLQIKQNIYSIVSFSCSCINTIYSKSIRRKKVPFFKVYHFSIRQHFSHVKV